MRSLFWKIFFTFWLAVALIAGMTFVLGRWMAEERWLMMFYPHLSEYAPQWTALYERQGIEAANQFSRKEARDNNIQASVLSADSDEALLSSMAAHHEGRGHRMGRRWRDRDTFRFSYEYTADSGNNYLFHFALPLDNVRNWQTRILFWPLSLAIALIAITLASWLLSLYLTRPIHRLREAVETLRKNHYQSDSLRHIGKRRDELGMLARDFNQMGEQLQTQITSQRQLLRDVSHELRSPLTRLRIALGLAERQPETASDIWPRLHRECDRLDQLIDEILALSRFDNFEHQEAAAEPMNLSAFLQEVLAEHPQLPIHLNITDGLWIKGWPSWLEKALSNLLRNSERFNQDNAPIEINLNSDGKQHTLTLRDHGPGCDPALLPRLGEPFFRAPGQKAVGYGLGLAIARRAIERHGGTLHFSLPADGGFQADINLPASDERDTCNHDH